MKRDEMRSLRATRQVIEREAVRAREEDRVPKVALVNGDVSVLGCPVLGSYCPPGWREVRRLGVDDSEFSKDVFLLDVKRGMGYGIVEAGQFRVFVGEFEKANGKGGGS